MKKLLSLILAAALLTTGATAYGSGTGGAVYMNYSYLAQGFIYENALSYVSPGKRVETFTVTDRGDNDIYPIVLACDTIYGGMTISRMTDYAESLGYNVVGAVNSDFGYWDTRVPCGMVVENGIYKSSPEGNNALAFFKDGGASAFFMPEVTITLKNDATGQSVSTAHLNKSRADGGLYLYSEYFSTVSTRTAGEGKFVRFRVTEDKELALSGTLRLEVTEVIEGETAVKIGKDSLILTATAASLLDGELDKFKAGDAVTLTTSCSDAALAGAQWVSGCGNILVDGGAEYKSEYWDSTITAANPRTAIGVKADGSLVYYVMDGRSTYSAGATMKQLCADLISMGCVTAVNMDGGGSTALSLRMPGQSGCTVVNTPSDGTQRSVCTYILFVTDSRPDGAARRLFLKEDGWYVLAGSAIPISFAATDGGYRQVSAPPGALAKPGTGTVSGGKYTAGRQAGMDAVSLTAVGISGVATIHVVTKPDYLTVKNRTTGANVSRLAAEQGETVELSATAMRYYRAVAADESAFSWSVSPEVGTITEKGVFTAAGKPSATGKITVSCAGTSVDIPVELAFEFADMKGHWAADFVKTLYDASIVAGTGDGSVFSPEAPMKRCDFMLMLYRAAGKPPASGSASFADVPADAYYSTAVAWAEKQGIASGTGGGLFDPAGQITREQGFAFLHRALSVLGIRYTDGDPAALDAFSDSQELSEWARTPAATLVGLGVVSGSGGRLEPKGSLTRAQMAALLCLTVYGAE